MRYLVAILFLLSISFIKRNHSNIGSPPNQFTDSLSKYSYCIYAVHNGDYFRAGSGFFIKKDPFLYFMSARHVFTGWDGGKYKRYTPYPDTLYIRLENKAGKLTFYRINIKPYKEKIKPFHYYDSADVFAELIKNPSDYNVNILNNFLNEDNDITLPELDTVVGYGYPGSTPIVGIKGSLELKASRYVAKISGSYETINIVDNNPKPDFFDYIVEKIEGNVGGGNSGSPAFFWITKSKKYIFGGMMIGHSKDGKYGTILRPNYVLENIKY
jgi:hypothetical protein